MPTCSLCNADIVPGSRWCAICHGNIVNPEIGKLASPIKRLGAYILDILIPITLIVFFTLMASDVDQKAVDEGRTGAAPWIALVFLVTILAFCIWSIVLFFNGRTPGKKLLGMQVVKEDGRKAGFFTMLFREVIGKTLSAMILSLGFLWILFDKENQGWHDKLMNTYVVN